MTDITEIMEMDEPDTGVDIDIIKRNFTYREDVYLCSTAAHFRSTGKEVYEYEQRNLRAHRARHHQISD